MAIAVQVLFGRRRTVDITFRSRVEKETYRRKEQYLKMYITVILLLLCVEIARSGELSTQEDEFLSLDMEYPADSDERMNILQPVIMDLTIPPRSGDGLHDVDESMLEPSRPHSHRGAKQRKRGRERHSAKSEGTETDFSTPQHDESPAATKEVPNVATTPVDIRAITWKPDSVALVKRCQYGLMREDARFAWNETECITCECKSSEVECKRPQCPQLTCKNQVQPAGECCPKCPEKLCETPDGRRFKHGAEWHMDDCTFCECRKGKVLCSVEDCQVPNCKNPMKVPGKCCPICLNTSCHASNGTRISSGEVWKEDICTHCYCAGGERKCGQEKCPYINCTTRHTPRGKCCEKCDEGVVDCVVSDWGSWTECPIQECGGGMRRRYRSVVIPHLNGGNFCPHMSEAEMCPRFPCDVLPVCPVTEWSAWGHCTATCGGGRRMRSRGRAPTTKATMTSLIDCTTTHFQETMHCYAGACISANTMFDAADSLIYDDICYKVTWSEWAACSSECGPGQQKRHQVLINNSHPQGHLCHLLDEIRTCQGQNCADKPTVTRCKVSPWGEWSACSKTCGPGALRTKYRRILQQPSGGARGCSRLFVSKPCKNTQCQPKIFSGSICLTENGQIYGDGDLWMEGPCKSCRCSNSQIQCQKVACGR